MQIRKSHAIPIPPFIEGWRQHCPKPLPTPSLRHIIHCSLLQLPSYVPLATIVALPQYTYDNPWNSHVPLSIPKKPECLSSCPTPSGAVTEDLPECRDPYLPAALRRHYQRYCLTCGYAIFASAAAGHMLLSSVPVARRTATYVRPSGVASGIHSQGVPLALSHFRQ